jgi:hypothetical protein
VEEPVFDDIGTTRLLLIHPALERQSVFEPEGPIQVARFEVDSARLDVAGMPVLDLLSGESCTITDTAFTTPLTDGPCRTGVVIEGSDDPKDMELTLEMTMEVRRATPRPDDADGVDGGNGDYDDDGVLDDGDGSLVPGDHPCTGGVVAACDDNCLLLPNADQADADADGIGDPCSLELLGSTVLDSDADGISDTSDNCIWIPNADQADTGGVSTEGIPDGIGDACEEQVATVVVPASLILGPEELDQRVGRVTFVTVDFDEALACDWEAVPPTCALAGPVGFCGRTTSVEALLGCP